MVARPGMRMNPNSLANLRPRKPGEGVKNPNGVRGPLITPALRKFAHLTLPELYELDGTKLTIGELIAVRYLAESMAVGSGDRARADVTDRLDGAVKDGIGRIVAENIQIVYNNVPRLGI